MVASFQAAGEKRTILTVATFLLHRRLGMYASLHTNRKADCPHKPYTVYVLIIEGELRTGSRGGCSWEQGRTQEFLEGGSAVGQRTICSGTPSPSFYALNFTHAEIKRGVRTSGPPL